MLKLASHLSYPLLHPLNVIGQLSQHLRRQHERAPVIRFMAEHAGVCDCGNVMDRDLNAAINLKNKAVSSTVTACGEDGSGRGGNTATKPTSVKQEDLSTSC